jgi:hypothetical protein
MPEFSTSALQELMPHGFYSKTITITDAQIKALPSVDVPLIEAPGVGKSLLFLFGRSIWDFRGGAYTNIGSLAPLGLWYKSTDADMEAGMSLNDSDVVDILADNSDVYAFDLGSPLFISASPRLGTLISYQRVTRLENCPIVFKMVNSLGNFTGGNVANKIKLVLTYTTVDV